MYDPFDIVSRIESGRKKRNITGTRYDAAFVARCSVFAALVGVGTLPVSFFFTTNLSPFIVYALFYVVLGLVAISLRTPSCGGEREEMTERRTGRGEESQVGGASSDSETSF